MRRTAHRGLTRSTGAAAAVALLLAGAAGCRSGSSGEDRRATERVEPSDFASEGGPGVALASINDGPAEVGVSGAPASGGGEVPVFRVVPGAPMTVTDQAPAIEAPQLLDGKVGDINGKPIFASTFFEPIEGRLRAEAAELERDPWMRLAAQIIQEELRGLITDELLRAEALSKLTVEEKAGLRRFLDGVRQNLLSQNLGSRQLAAQRLQREQGLTEEEYLKQREERTLVRFTVQQEIEDRVNVSWRDIVRRYQRDNQIYNPEPVARFRIVRIDADDGAARAALDAAIADGTVVEFAESDANTWTVDPGGLREIAASEGLEGVELLNSEEINEAARGLTEGATAGPIALGSSLMWVHLEGVASETIDLYDAQLPIAQQIRSERTNQELQRYIDRLLGRASVTDINRMILRLLTIAADRYAPEATLPGRR